MLAAHVSHVAQIADGLADDGFAVVDHFLTDNEVEAILRMDEFNNALLHFKKAGIGNTQSRQINEAVRGDYIHWLDGKTAHPSVLVYYEKIMQLITHLNQSLFLSLKDVELHLTTYPAGSFYKRHLDQFKAGDHRKVSVILYLNKDWEKDTGGQLRIYPQSKQLDILPLAGRLVCLRSDAIEHEVLPATRERLSITGWLLDQFVENKNP